MSLPNKLFAPAFAEPKTRWLFLLLIGVMVYVASFALTVEGMVSAFTLTWDHRMDSRMTVELPAIEDEGLTPDGERVRQIVTALRAMPEILHAEPLPIGQTQQLLKPWIADTELLKSLPVPSLIDIDKVSGAILTAADLQERLRPIVATVQVDDHAAWLTDLLRVVHGLMAIAAIIIILTGFAVVFVVSLLCRTVVATEHETIALLHIMGADDRDIASYFQRHAGRLAVIPSLGGFFTGIGSGALLLFLLRPVMDNFYLSSISWAGLGGAALAIPIITIVIAAYSARATVMNLLLALP